eukprot:TRINITY_DN6185_c0_g4_i1.p1 TRINITY_DN6185_c0_g4~~TRINITY_DN6185_c0_g4_i1.p1  ORF type:complete len:336 (-),score=90.86 TRINITY_DN6185_c0_g4_i1:33-1040(-)
MCIRDSTGIMPERERLSRREVAVLETKVANLRSEKAELVEKIEEIKTLVREDGLRDKARYQEELRVELEKKRTKAINPQNKPTEHAKEEETPELVNNILKEPAQKVESKPSEEMHKEIPMKPQAEVNDSASEFSFGSHVSELPPNSNLMDLLIIEAVFDDTKVPAAVPFATSIAVDFYNHDSKHSEKKEGMRARYALQIEFLVEVDEGFMGYLWEKSIDFAFHLRDEAEPKVLGSAKLPLRQFFDLNVKEKLPTLVGKVPIMSRMEGGSAETKIGYLRYKLKMRYSITNELIQYKEKVSKTRGVEQAVCKVEIIGCSNLVPVSYTHLTLPTICSV